MALTTVLAASSAMQASGDLKTYAKSDLEDSLAEERNGTNREGEKPALNVNAYAASVRQTRSAHSCDVQTLSVFAQSCDRLSAPFQRKELAADKHSHATIKATSS